MGRGIGGLLLEKSSFTPLLDIGETAPCEVKLS
jgi:hypothetical protein